MKKIEDRIYQILKDTKFIADTDLDAAYQSAKEMQHPLSDILIFRGLITEEALSQLIAENINIPYVSLRNRVVNDEILNLIPEEFARRHRLIPFEKDDKSLSLAMEDPENFESLELVKRLTGLTVKPFFTSKPDISRALSQYKKDIQKKLEAIISENVTKTEAVGEDNPRLLSKVASDLPVVKIFEALLEYAVAEGASDLHLETQKDSFLVRMRIDGVLRDVMSLPREIQPAVVARIKIISNLKIDEHRVPQDGRFKFNIDDSMIALRVSIIPGLYGENVVLRILPESARPLSLAELGITGENLKKVEENIRKPHGMVLVTGPTGCGKTTTLYSILSMLNTPKVKICTIEDPIEYGVVRVNQIQVNPQTGLTFAAGLRALLRHDPNVIMVGEIRDEETADMAIHSALTGHLVLSTLHTNDAASTIPRFLDMGAEGYLIASTLNLAIAQRLVRRICTACTEEYIPEKEMIMSLEKLTKLDLSKQKFYQGKGCVKCHQTGFRGRVGIYEILENTEKVKELTLRKASAEEILKTVVSEGMKTMLVDGMDKVGAGFTTVEEVLAAVKE